MKYFKASFFALIFGFSLHLNAYAQNPVTVPTAINAIVADSLLAPAAQPVLGPSIEFKEDKHDFGQIKQGDRVEHTFIFRNNGTMPLVISKVRTTCGCTATDYPTAPIMPGEKATLSARFDSAGKTGAQNKVITIESNAVQGNTQVFIQTTILKAK